ncbi:sulfite exporter TauE/SafE family protein [Patescibacteria group bacterium]|nr:sulfite exporter TauE/SafE family protein [Patescibacteria group bacterium]
MFIINGFLLGLATGVFCLTWCGPVLTSLILTERRRIKQSFFLFFKFIFGRLIGYILFGGLIGYLGLKIESEIVRKANLGALVFLAVLLIFYGVGWLKQKKLFCQFFKKIKFPFVAGFLTGINICPPFLIALAYVFDVGGISEGILFFISFFVATCLYLVPFVFLGFLSSKRVFQRIAQVIAILAGTIFLIYGLRGLLSPSSCATCSLYGQGLIENYIPLIVFCLLIFLAVILSFSKSKKYFWSRNLILLISLIYFGFVLKNALCPIRTFQLLFIDGSKIVMSLVLFLFFLLPIILALLIGKIYCNWICPLGGFQEFIFQGKRLIKCKYLSKDFLPKGKWRTQFKYFFLVFIILVLLILREPILCGIDPFGTLFGRFVTTVSIVLLFVLIISSIFIHRPWCQFFCPYGAVLSLLSKLSFFKKSKGKK